MKMAEATYYGTGRRKTSVARVRLVAGQGNIVINGRVLDDYFDLKTLEIIVKQPLELTGTTAVYDVIASRMKERKKYGLKKARKASQFSKR